MELAMTWTSWATNIFPSSAADANSVRYPTSLKISKDPVGESVTLGFAAEALSLRMTYILWGDWHDVAICCDEYRDCFISIVSIGPSSDISPRKRRMSPIRLIPLSPGHRVTRNQKWHHPKNRGLSSCTNYSRSVRRNPSWVWIRNCLLWLVNSGDRTEKVIFF